MLRLILNIVPVSVLRKKALILEKIYIYIYVTCQITDHEQVHQHVTDGDYM